MTEDRIAELVARIEAIDVTDFSDARARAVVVLLQAVPPEVSTAYFALTERMYAAYHEAKAGA